MKVENVLRLLGPLFRARDGYPRDLAQLVCDGRIRVKCERLARVPMPVRGSAAFAEMLARNKPWRRAAVVEIDRSGHRIEHYYLKWIAKQWVQSCGEIAPQAEATYFGQHRTKPGPRADLLAPTLRWIVECGDTESQRVIDALRAGFARFVLLPFSSNETTPWLRIVCFSCVGDPASLPDLVRRERPKPTRKPMPRLM